MCNGDFRNVLSPQISAADEWRILNKTDIVQNCCLLKVGNRSKMCFAITYYILGEWRISFTTFGFRKYLTTILLDAYACSHKLLRQFVLSYIYIYIYIYIVSILLCCRYQCAIDLCQS